VTAFATSSAHSLMAETLPVVRVSDIRRIEHNGEHNAFTDLCRFRGRIWLAFRSCPNGHGVHPTSSIVVLNSEDGREWTPAFRFSVPRRDVRDPHFLVYRERLFVYTGAWYCGDSSPKSYDMNQHLGFAASTVDGENWHGPEMLEGTYGHYVWRAATFGGKAYLCGRRKKHFAETATRAERDPLVESVLLESDDGIVWKRCGVFQETYGDETAFLFEPDGSILAVARSGGGRNAQICRAKPPYSEFSRVDLDRYIGGPLLTKWGSRYVVGGRKMLGGPARCSLYWLTGGQLHEFAELPSGGDTSYPGFLETGPDRALLSWYSSHEKNADGQTMTAIYLADLTIAPPASDD
jgi:hypothetical protein